VFINRFPLASPSETREYPEKESTSSTDKGPEEEGDQVNRNGETIHSYNEKTFIMGLVSPEGAHFS
jgi:hypothetical protein